MIGISKALNLRTYQSYPLKIETGIPLKQSFITHLANSVFIALSLLASLPCIKIRCNASTWNTFIYEVIAKAMREDGRAIKLMALLQFLPVLYHTSVKTFRGAV